MIYHRAIRSSEHGPLGAGVVDPLALSPAFAAQWDALALHASEPNAFAERWCLAPALQLLDPHRRARLIAVEAAGELIGLLPLTTVTRYGPVPLRHSSNWAHPNHFHGAPLVRAGHELPFWQALLGWCDSAPGGGALLQLQRLTENGPLHRALTDALALRGQSSTAPVHRETRALLQSGLTPAAYWDAAVRPKKRKELRRQAARLSESGALLFRHWQPGEVTAPWLDAFLALEAQGWKGQAGSALASNPATQAWARTIILAAAQAGRLDMRMLAQDGAPIAMLINFVCPPGGFAFKTAYAEDLARFSPGVLLQQANLGLLDHPDLDWVDSCAAPGHPMIDSIWRERRTLVWVNAAVGGRFQRLQYAALTRAEAAWRKLRAKSVRAPAQAGALADESCSLTPKLRPAPEHRLGLDINP
ncbi:MAG: GNAT family N-acetyltransferase [Sphingopyxis sp.]|nr:GNAT family N-acetyltransferase [Sphingopyxis sp.]